MSMILFSCEIVENALRFYSLFITRTSYFVVDITVKGPMILRAWLAMLYRVLVSRQILQTVAFFSVLFQFPITIAVL